MLWKSLKQYNFLPKRIILKKKKICIVRSGDVTFISRIHRTALALQETNDYDVSIVSIIPRDNIKRVNYPYNMHYITIKSRALKHSVFSIIRIIEGIYKLFFKSFKNKADIYIAIGVEDLIIAYLISIFSRAKFIYSANELEGDRNRAANKRLNKLLNKAVIGIERFLLKRAEGVFAADIERAEIMKQWYNLDNVEVIRNVPFYEDVPNYNLIRERLELSKNQKILLYQGIINYGRGIEVAIKACSMTNIQNNFCLVLLGFITDDYKQTLIEFAKKNNFESLHILPPVPWGELLHWTKSADVSLVLIENVSISYYLAAPNKLYESIMAGKPYIASNFPEINHVHNVSNSGLLVSPESPHEVSVAISRLLEDEVFYKECVDNSLKGKEVFNWNREKKTLIEFMDKL